MRVFYLSKRGMLPMARNCAERRMEDDGTWRLRDESTPIFSSCPSCGPPALDLTRNQ